MVQKQTLCIFDDHNFYIRNISSKSITLQPSHVVIKYSNLVPNCTCLPSHNVNLTSIPHPIRHWMVLARTMNTWGVKINTCSYITS